MRKFYDLTAIALLLLLGGLTGQVKCQTPMYHTNPTISAGGNSIPFSYTNSCRGQQIYPAGVFGNPPNNMVITTLYFMPGTSYTGSQTYSNIQVYLKQDNITTLSGSVYETGMTQVFAATNYTINYVGGQWFSIQLQNPFPFDPSMPLIWEVNQQVSSGSTWYCHVHNPVPSGAYRNYSTTYNSATPIGANAYMLDMGIDLIPAFTGPNDAGVTTFVEPTRQCVGTHPVSVEIKNFGTNAIDTVTVNWSVNGIPRTPVMYTGFIDTNNGLLPNMDTVFLGNITLQSNITEYLEAWTTMPNNIVDTVWRNDTAYFDIRGQAYPTIDLGYDTTLCPGDSLTLDAGPNRDSIFWSNNETTRFTKVASTGMYKVTVYKKSCGSSDSMNLDYHNPPPTINVGGDTVICSKDSLLLNATTPGVTYRWKNNSTSPTQYVQEEGVYWVIITDANTCKSGDTLEITHYEDPGVTMTVSPDNNLCYEEPVTFTATPQTAGSIMYQWKINGIDAIPPTAMNTFSPTNLVNSDTVDVDLLTDLCVSGVAAIPSNRIRVKISPLPRDINLIPDVDTVVENRAKNYGVQHFSGHTYLWRVKGGVIVGDSLSNIVKVRWGPANPTAMLTLIETDEKNCTRPNELPVVIISVVGINEEQNIELGNAYPNPANQTINIPVYAGDKSDIQLDLLDVTGKIVHNVYSGEVSSNRIFEVDISSLEQGMYFYRITTSQGLNRMEKITIRR